ncbi:DUF3307 domain-containing protein [Phenylobacterium sp.]|jgi:hypothetical protein|uniref:DUF3307 domain-containing protein n=1 Tax=Phenylobacterium sp. TaxID=1871053 RepID=UPI002F91EC4C
MLQLAFWLVASHAVCDFALQPDAMARGKSRRHGVILAGDQRHEPGWLMWLSAHSMVHAAGVAGALAIVGRADLWWLGLAEAGLHGAIDHLKSDRRITMITDQVLHLACKALWIAAAAALPEV